MTRYRRHDNVRRASGWAFAAAAQPSSLHLDVTFWQQTAGVTCAASDQTRDLGEPPRMNTAASLPDLSLETVVVLTPSSPLAGDRVLRRLSPCSVTAPSVGHSGVQTTISVRAPPAHSGRPPVMRRQSCAGYRASARIDRLVTRIRAYTYRDVVVVYLIRWPQPYSPDDELRRFRLAVLIIRCDDSSANMRRNLTVLLALMRTSHRYAEIGASRKLACSAAMLRAEGGLARRTPRSREHATRREAHICG